VNVWKGKLLEDLYCLAARRRCRAQHGCRSRLASSTRNLLALRSAPPGTEKPLWETLDELLRAPRCDGDRGTRVLWRHVSAVPVVARALSGGRRSVVLAYSPDRADLFARICGY
jgi:[protein-PII] uridylyltransferase